jgi:outer membrane protein
MSVQLVLGCCMLAMGVSQAALAEETVSETEYRKSWNGFSFRLGGLFLQPLGSAKEVELSNVSGVSRLIIDNGPIAGSSIGISNALIFAGTVGYAPPILNRQLSIEAVLALPFTLKLRSRGTLATASLAPFAAGNVPTGLPALGEVLGETTVLPPVVTLVYRFLPGLRFHPYLGAGVSVLFAYNARITNSILTEVGQPTVSILPRAGWVLQGGVDVRLYQRFYLSADVKFIGGLALQANVDEIFVRLPNLPLYDIVKVGSATASVVANPLVFQLGVGMNL